VSLSGRGGDAQWDWPLLSERCQREARRLLRNPDDAEDAAQEALARAWRKRHTCRTPGTPVPWLIAITRNEAYRLMGRRRDVPSPRDALHGESAGLLSLDDLATRIDVRRALERLPSEERVLLHLRYRQDLKQHSIADLLDTPEGTIKVRLYRARRRLRDHLRDDPEANQASK
jgi:RNA polymerase sigma-70 factor, ECF subfamily